MLKKFSNKAAVESKPEAYPLRYAEDFDEPRMMLEIFFSALLGSTAIKAHISPFLQQRDAS